MGWAISCCFGRPSVWEARRTTNSGPPLLSQVSGGVISGEAKGGAVGCGVKRTFFGKTEALKVLCPKKFYNLCSADEPNAAAFG